MRVVDCTGAIHLTLSVAGTERGVTLGTPIGLFVPNKNVRPGDYKEMAQVPRPGHADYTYQVHWDLGKLMLCSAHFFG